MADATPMKDAVRWMWSLGDYGALAEYLEPHAIELAHRCGIHPGTEVLDVAAGNGNFAIAAARLGATVVATDLTPAMVELGRARTRDLGLAIEWHEADAEELPFPEARFDVVASVFGAMFAPRPEQVAAELFRVARTGGRVVMANYGPNGFLARFTGLLAAYGPAPPPGMPSAFDWGDRDEVHRRFAGRTSAIEVYPQTLSFQFELGRGRVEVLAGDEPAAHRAAHDAHSRAGRRADRPRAAPVRGAEPFSPRPHARIRLPPGARPQGLTGRAPR